MGDTIAIQKSFLIFESVFCFVVSFFMAIHVISAERKNLSNRIIMVSNFFAGLLLLSDFLAYTYRGGIDPVSFYMVRISNFLSFFIADLVLFLYVMYVAVQLFGAAGLTVKVPGRLRLRIVYALSLFNILLLVISQFNGMFYTIDEKNIYHRGDLFPIRIIISGAGVLMVLTVLIEYRKKMDKLKFLVLISYMILPVIAMIIQIRFYGLSLINTAIGFSMLMMFVENSISQSREILKISKLEVRTGLYNEHGCIIELDNLRSRGKIKGYAAIFFDISKFSEINRKYGMKAGDQVLKQYASMLKAIMKPDEILSRQGSDHFIAIVKNENLHAVLDFLSGTKMEITYGREEDKKAEISVSAIAGVYEIDEDNIKSEDILANAYSALLYAKTVSKKKVDYMTTELREMIDKERAYVSVLYDSLEKREFFAYYQPKVNIESNKLCGAEALARWVHEGKLVAPGKFIPVMEKNDSVCSLDFYILKNVCEDIKEWIDKGLEIPTISVNFSRRNLSNTNLAEDIDKVICDYGIPKDLIEIEITETNDEFPISVLKEFVYSLHSLGYKVAVDDFGCGAASLSLLREADFDTLKIDKSFIDNAFEKDQTILTHIINLAKAIDMKIIAEGVENRWQEEKLQELGVGIVQGFYFDKPVPKDEMVKRIVNKDYSK